MQRLFTKRFFTQKLQIRRFTTEQKLEPLEKSTGNKVINTLLGLFITGVAVADLYYMYTKSLEPKQNILLDSEFTKCQLKEIVKVSHDTYLYKINCKTLQTPVPFHVILKDDTCQIARPYTPVYFKDDEMGLLIKHYTNGSISSMLQSLKIGDWMFVRGPIQTMSPYQPNAVKHLTMIAAGTGITPMYQLIKKVISDPDDKTEIVLYYCNKTKDDILLKRELDLIAKDKRVKVVYALDDQSVWSFSKEYTKTLQINSMKSILPSPTLGRDMAVLVCGPDGFVNAVAGPKGLDDIQGPLGGILSKLGYSTDQVYKL